MKRILNSLIHPLSRFTQTQAQAEPLGELLWVEEAHTVVPWKPKFNKPPALRRPLANNDPLNPIPRVMDPIQVGCVEATMRKVAAEARQELTDLQELLPMHRRSTAPQEPILHVAREPKAQWVGKAALGALALYLILINTL